LKIVKGYSQSYILTDVRIFVGLLSTIFGAVLAYLSVTRDYSEYRTVAVCFVSIYFVLNLTLEVILRFFNKRLIFSGKGIGGCIKVKSSVLSPDTKYVLSVYKNEKKVPREIILDFCELFDREGVLLHERFLERLDSSMSDKDD
jgi:hypothetical protein